MRRDTFVFLTTVLAVLGQMHIMVFLFAVGATGIWAMILAHRVMAARLGDKNAVPHFETVDCQDPFDLGEQIALEPGEKDREERGNNEDEHPAGLLRMRSNSSKSTST